MGELVADFNVNMGPLMRALLTFQQTSKKAFSENLVMVAKGVIKRVIALTPPASGKANSGAKQAGEAAIMRDLFRIFMPQSRENLEQFWGMAPSGEIREEFAHKGQKALGTVITKVLKREDLVGWHNSRRNATNGRVMGGGAGGSLNRTRAASLTTGLRKKDLLGLDIGLVESRDFKWFADRVKARVGILAAGWNRAADTLKVSRPQWIKRHGSGRGDIKVNLSSANLSIVASNDVRYAGNVRDLDRRVQSAVNQQAEALRRRIAQYLEKQAGKLVR